LPAYKVKVRYSFEIVTALAHQKLANHLVVRYVPANLVAEPTRVRPSAFLSSFVVARAEHVGKTHGPKVSALRAIKKIVDYPRPFPWINGTHKGGDFFKRRRNANRIQIHAAQELLIGREFRG